MKKIAILLLLIVFMVSCTKGSGNWAAKIDEKEIITVKEFEEYLDIIARMNLSEGEAAIKKQDNEFRKAGLDNLISQKILLKEMEKTDVIKPQFIEVFQLQALSKYFIMKNVQPKIDIPTDEFIQAKYDQFKGELSKRGITDPNQAKKIIVSEYQKAKYMNVLMDQMKKLKGEYRKTLNDDMEQPGKNVLQDYIQNKSKEDPSKVWLFRIEGKEYTAADADKFVSAMVEINYGKDGFDRYLKDSKFNEQAKAQVFEDYFAATLVLTDAQAKGWINNEEVKRFTTIFINNEKVKFYMKAKIGLSLEKPTEEELKAYYARIQKEVNKPYAEVKEQLTYRLFSEKAEMKALKYVEKIKDARKIEINSQYFETKKEDAKQPAKK